MERSRGLSDTPQVVNATAVWQLPFGDGKTFNPGNRIVRALVSGYQLSGIYTYNSGIPLAITSSGCVDPGQSQCMPNFNPTFSGNARVNGKYGSGATARSSPSYININAFVDPSVGSSKVAATAALYPNYTIGNLARTAPYGLRGPSSYDVDISLQRTIAIHEKYNIVLQAQAFNLTNVVIFNGPPVSTSTASTFGTVTGQSNLSRDIQLEGRFTF